MATRHQDEIGCPVCRKGVAEQVMTTREERIEFGCRIDGDEECCARAFVCTLCGARILASAEPPEPSWDYK